MENTSFLKQPSSRLFFPLHGKLFPYDAHATHSQKSSARIVNSELNRLLSQESAWKVDQYRVGIYTTLGTGQSTHDLAQDLAVFKQECLESNSLFLSFVAVFEKSKFLNEAKFEQALWKELSLVASLKEYQIEWNPASVMGLHPLSPKKELQFYLPTLVFGPFKRIH